jgi:glyoxylate/hydroxypyruvate reductase
MQMTTLIIGTSRSETFADGIRAADPAFDFRVWPETGNADVRYALAWGPPPGELAKFPNLELIVSVGAGVDHLFKDPALPNVPVVRFVDQDLTGRMVSFVAANVLFHHRRMIELRDQQRDRNWNYLPEPAAHELTVGIMGLGVLGQACAKALAVLGYKLNGWTRTERQVTGVTCFAGAKGLDAFLSSTDILVSLLPLTPDTRGIINAQLLGKLRRPKILPGPVLINAGRGGLQIEDDILSCLDAGTLYAASLDVFSTEPLPATSPVWAHPRVVLTPHIAAESDPRAIARYLIEQVNRQKRGEPLPNLVDRARGY